MTHVGLWNPEGRPEDYEDLYCPCNSGVPTCPANLSTEAELYRYKSVTYDDFYDLSQKDPSAWILRTFEELQDFRFVPPHE